MSEEQIKKLKAVYNMTGSNYGGGRKPVLAYGPHRRLCRDATGTSCSNSGSHYERRGRMRRTGEMPLTGRRVLPRRIGGHQVTDAWEDALFWFLFLGAIVSSAILIEEVESRWKTQR